MGSRNRLDRSVGDRSLPDFSVGVEIDLILCGGRKCLKYGSKVSCSSVGGDRNGLVFGVGIENDLASVLGSEMTLLLCGGSKLT